VSGKLVTHLSGNKAISDRQFNEVYTLAERARLAGRPVDLTLSERTRSPEANARLHAMLTWLSKNHTWAGQKLSTITWKRLCVAAFLRAKGKPVEMYPALDGHGVDIVFERTSEMSGKVVSELCTWILAWADDQGLNMPEVRIDPDTGRPIVTYARPPELPA
jgi:hypothetical protein